MRQKQLSLPLGSVRNSNLFSNHWLENRLPLEPEWAELRDRATGLLDQLGNLWARERNRVEQYSEAGLEKAFIHPVLSAMGWAFDYQVPLRGGRPDYALFLEESRLDDALKAGRGSIDSWKFPALVADAKAWNINLDRPMIVGKKREYPPEQIERYLNHSERDYGILTNGRCWRLFPRILVGHQPRFETYLECDLADILSGWTRPGQRTFAVQQRLIDDFLRFLLLFSPVAFRAIEGRSLLIDRAIKGSSEYRVGVGEGLKGRVFEALELCIEGFLNHHPNNLNPQTDLATAKEQSLILLYRLLFIMYAEDRDLLPLRSNLNYAANRSLSRFREDISSQLDRIAEGRSDEYAAASTSLWGELLKLFDLIDAGGRYGVPAYNGGLFDPDENPFLTHKALSDKYLARIIDRLSRAPDVEHPEAGLSRVDYRDLAIQHLGHVYEGLLELHPHYASEPMSVIRRSDRQRVEERAIAARAETPAGYERTERTYKPGQVFLLTDKGERRASGSYYTPNHIVDYIVERTLGPLCRQISDDLAAEIEETRKRRAAARAGPGREQWDRKLQELRGDFDDRVLRLRVLDPAMGSGHFLLRACQRLAEEIATNPNAADAQADQLTGEESVLTFWKRRIVEHCLYGVDLNSMAVELAKVALWLETASVNQPLTFLDHHLRHGNSLVGGWVRQLGALGTGEPLPLFQRKAEARLPAFLQVLNEIGSIPSETAAQVKQKGQLYRDSFAPIRAPFLRAADLWCSDFFALPGQVITGRNYEQTLVAIDQPKAFAKLAKEDWFTRAMAVAGRPDVACFHWELEFPEAFFDLSGRRDEGGFDAIIGNPPYDVLSDRETGRDLTSLRKFLQAQPIYDSSFRGKNNLYKLFVCLGLALLRDGGRMGFITPMAILGDDQAADLRRQILDQAAFTSVDAFPQKDDPDRRVFREAKLSTAVFTLAKSADAAIKAQPFVARVHPADRIEESSPSLKLTTASIPLYDPANVTVVSCSQEDWDLAVRIMGSGRMARFGENATSFQGEVNETNDRNAGTISYDAKDGPEAIRGAHVCLYAAREASQGTPVYVKVGAFMEGVREDSKATHSQRARIGFQRKSPQNNFRRLIATPISAGVFLVESVSYVPEHHSRIPLPIVLAILNSKLAEWFFRLGSTNAMIGEYQVKNLPCPQFADPSGKPEKAMLAAAMAAIRGGQLDQAFDALRPGLAAPPFSPAVRGVIVELVNRIIQAEQARGEIARSDRSALCPAAQPWQDLIDRLFYAMAGLSDAEAAALESRLKTML